MSDLRASISAVINKALLRNGVQLTGKELGPVTDDVLDYISDDEVFDADLKDYRGALPVITTEPADRTIKPGETASFSVAVKEPKAAAFQWMRNGVSIPAATQANYQTEPAKLSDNGTQYSVEVSNATGTVTSDLAVLTVATEGAAPVPSPTPVPPAPVKPLPAPPVPPATPSELPAVPPTQEPPKNV